MAGAAGAGRKLRQFVAIGREGKRDRLAGDAKETAERAKDKVEEGIDKVKDKLTSRDRS